MTNKTEGVKVLTQDVLNTFSEPYGENIIEDVFLAIEYHRDWRRRYDELCSELRQWVGSTQKKSQGWVVCVKSMQNEVNLSPGILNSVSNSDYLKS